MTTFRSSIKNITQRRRVQALPRPYCSDDLGERVGCKKPGRESRIKNSRETEDDSKNQTLLKIKSELDWMVRHCSLNTIINHPLFNALNEYQSNISYQRHSNTLMDWCRIFEQVYHRSFNEKKD